MTTILKIANKSTAFLYIKNWKNAYIEIINKVGVTTGDNHRARVLLFPYCLRVTYFRFQRGHRFPGMYVLGSFAGKPPGEKIPRSPLKWLFSCLRAPAEVPARIRDGVDAVPIERPGNRAAAHATTGDNHFPAFGLPVIITEVCRA